MQNRYCETGERPLALGGVESSQFAADASRRAIASERALSAEPVAAPGPLHRGTPTSGSIGAIGRASVNGLLVSSGRLPPMILVSFDIDGTLEVGDPPGPLTLDMVRLAKSSGWVIGSASDRTVAEQEKMWDKA